MSSPNRNSHSFTAERHEDINPSRPNMRVTESCLQPFIDLKHMGEPEDPEIMFNSVKLKAINNPNYITNYKTFDTLRSSQINHVITSVMYQSTTQVGLKKAFLFLASRLTPSETEYYNNNFFEDNENHLIGEPSNKGTNRTNDEPEPVDYRKMNIAWINSQTDSEFVSTSIINMLDGYGVLNHRPINSSYATGIMKKNMVLSFRFPKELKFNEVDYRIFLYICTRTNYTSKSFCEKVLQPLQRTFYEFSSVREITYRTDSASWMANGIPVDIHKLYEELNMIANNPDPERLRKIMPKRYYSIKLDTAFFRNEEKKQQLAERFNRDYGMMNKIMRVNNLSLYRGKDRKAHFSDIKNAHYSMPSEYRIQMRSVGGYYIPDYVNMRRYDKKSNDHIEMTVLISMSLRSSERKNQTKGPKIDRNNSHLIPHTRLNAE